MMAITLSRQVVHIEELGGYILTVVRLSDFVRLPGWEAFELVWRYRKPDGTMTGSQHVNAGMLRTLTEAMGAARVWLRERMESAAA